MATRYYRKIIHIGATDSPNVQAGIEAVAKGLPVPEPIIPGVIDYDTYMKRLATWDPIRICIGVYGQFYEGAEVLLYPPDWLNRAESIAEQLRSRPRTGTRTLGIDAAEGGDSTVWTVIDMLGILTQLSIKTSDTSDIPGRTLAMMRQWKVSASNVLFDLGGGGKQHVDRLRALGHNVRGVRFGESTVQDLVSAIRLPGKDTKVDTTEERYVYKNRRAEMYGMLRTKLLDPALVETGEGKGFGIGAEYTELRKQMAPMPLLYDGEGRMYLPPKSKPYPDYTKTTITQMLGRSPDELDSLVLAVFGLFNKPNNRLLEAL